MAIEVILREDIDKLGSRGQLVRVAPGFARNYLLPRKLAVAATESNRKIVEQERQAHLRREAKLSGEASELARMMAGVSLSFKAKAGENDQLFGSVTSQDIANSLEQQGYKIDRRKIVMDDAIKSLGDHKVTLKLHKEVSVEIPVHVGREEE
jgi:large subunit ribosomal protein L9